MDAGGLPRRDEVPVADTWDIDSVFADTAAWEAAVEAMEPRLARVGGFRDRLAESGAVLLEWLRLTEELWVDVGRILTYATMAFDTDTTEPGHAARHQRAQALWSRAAAATAFEAPEIVAAGRQRVDALMAEEPDLVAYAHHFDRLLRRVGHVRSAEVEEVMALAGDALWSFYTVRSSLVDGDMQHGTVKGAGEDSSLVAEGTINALMVNPDRVLRRAAWERYADGFLAQRHTLAALLSGHVKGSVFGARARHYASVREAALDPENLPGVTFEHVVSAYREHVGIWHRYWRLRRRVLGLARLAPYDVWAPLTSQEPEVTYDQACAWILDGIAPLGAAYTEPLARGLAAERWVDVFPNQGKRGGAYSGGTYDTRPFVLLNWTGGLWDMSVLAHELGHSMHSYRARLQQPPHFAEYSIFAAEVASNFNQAMVRAHLLSSSSEPYFQIAVLSEALANFHRYLFVMPILAQIEDTLFGWVEAGAGLTADGLSALTVDMFRAGFGPEVELDEPRLGMTWATFPHLFMNYYVFQYATGIAAASVLAEDVLGGREGAVEGYLAFLSAGGSRYPIDALRLAGVDMTRREPLDRAYATLARYVDHLERLLIEVGLVER